MSNLIDLPTTRQATPLSGVLESISILTEPSPAVDAPVLVKGLAVAVCTYQRPNSVRRFLQSLADQNHKIAQVIIVDASANEDTAQIIRNSLDLSNLADRFLYFHVSADRKGLTRQRNFAARWVVTDLVAFFDDDVVLMPGCLREMERVHRSLGDKVAGVCAVLIDAESQERLIRYHRHYYGLMHFFRIISTRRPGAYNRSGFNVPWVPPAETQELIEGDWLLGGATMWKTLIVRDVSFDENFQGYSLGEDLDFSLRARERGKLFWSAAARVQHLVDGGARPNPYDLGYMQIRNLYRIHQRALADRKWTDVLWFIYGWTLESFLLIARYSLNPRLSIWYLGLTAGRISAATHIVWGALRARILKLFKVDSSGRGELNP